ncbi:MAG: sulfatase [Opitutae bacterium]|nr:sulfatase [Opitutae bacterium]
MFRLCLLSAALLPLALIAAPAESPRPNILWLIGDDLGVELGCYGEPEVRTPHLDRLAAGGMRYSRFYTTAPVCSSSRSAFMTGLYAVTLGAHDHRTANADKRPLPDGVQLLSHWFRAAGYTTANIADFPVVTGIRGTAKTDWNFLYAGEAFDLRRWRELKGRTPFFAQVNFREPHRPFKAPTFADPAKVHVPACYPDHPVVRQDWAAYLDAVSELDRKIGVVLQLLDADGLADNTIVVFFGDNGRPHVRDKQFCYEGGLHVPLLIRWPKNFPAPAGFRPGAVESRLLAAIDLAPTMLALVGAPVPPAMQGQVFLGPRSAAPREFVVGARDRCDETSLTIRTVRDARYRYIRNLTTDQPYLATNQYKERGYPVWTLLKELHATGRLAPAQDAFCASTMPAEELYDLDTDPDQIVNLAASPDLVHQSALRRLRAALAQWQRDVGDRAPSVLPASTNR